MQRGFLVGAFGMVLVAGGLIAPPPGYSQRAGADNRQDARDVKQQGREDARAAQADCKAGDEKTRAECRKEKRDAKDGAKDAAKDGQ